MSIAPLSFPGEFRLHSLTLLFHCLDPDIGEFDPVPHAHFPRSSYGSCGSPLDLQETGRLAGLFEVVERDFESDVHDVVEFTRRPRIHTKLRITGNQNASWGGAFHVPTYVLRFQCRHAAPPSGTGKTGPRTTGTIYWTEELPFVLKIREARAIRFIKNRK
jgi:hypothetical protein